MGVHKRVVCVALALIVSASAGCDAQAGSSPSVTRYPNGLTLVKSDRVTWMTMDEPENVTLEFSRFRGALDVLPTGCIVLRAKDGYSVAIWPTGTTVDGSGTIRSRIGTFRIGQQVDGSASSLRRTQLKPPGAVNRVCPADELGTYDINQYARIDDGLKVIEQ